MEEKSLSDRDDDDVTMPKCFGETGMADPSAIQSFQVEGAEGGNDATSRDLVGHVTDPDTMMTAPTTSGGLPAKMEGNIHFAAQMEVSHNLTQNLSRINQIIKPRIYGNYVDASTTNTMEDMSGYTQIKDQSQVEINREASLFTSTPAYRDALQQLEASGLLFITGPAGSGKTSIATALLRHYQQQDRTPLVLHRYEEFRHHVGGDRRQVILLEDIFGDEEFLYKRYKKWSRAVAVLREFCKQKKCIAVITIRDTVIAGLKAKCNSKHIVSNLPILEIEKSKTPTDSEKTELLHKHTKEAGKILTSSVVRDILVVDTSKHMFPKCCRDFAESVDINVSLKDIFKDDIFIISTPLSNQDVEALTEELMNAVQGGDVHHLRQLLQRGVSVMSEDIHENLPLHVASKSGNLQVVELLLDWIADINAKDAYQYTALHNACSMGWVEVVRLLLKKKADVDVAEKSGWTAVHFAARGSRGHTG
ncbi:uncharacterized protein [Littorina saxatilis]|uniref:uncharacterized protein n=1 Tax=Littorina saxatilis TaxID=31220 RepID=UPI0038B553C6